MLKRLVVGISLVSLFFCGLLQAKSEKLVLVTTNWRPYVQVDAAFPGFAHELVTNAFAQAGLNVEVRFMTWPDALAAAESGKVDGIFPIYQTKSRSAAFAFSKPFSGGPLALYKRRQQAIPLKQVNFKGKPEQILKSLHAYRFGVVKQFAYYPAFDNDKAIKKVEALSEEENLQQLAAGKVDFVIMEKLVAHYILAHDKTKSLAKNIECIAPEIANQKLFVAIPKSHPQHQKLLKAFNQGLHQITVNGTLSHLLDQDARRLNLRAIA